MRAPEPMGSQMPIYRNPIWVAGPEIFTAEEIGDKLDWGQEAHKLPDVWKVTKGAGVLVGVCDTGRPVHPDLKDKVKFSRNFSDSGTDLDKQGHNTHVAGTIAANADGKGVVGVAPEAQLCIAKVLGDDGSGSHTSIAAGIRYCLECGCDIISMSLGGGPSQEVERAVKEAVDAGVFVICAAGNSGEVPGQNTMGWPARLPWPLAVGAYNKEGQIAKFSSRGKEIDIAFPGENIVSTWPGGGYRALSGTSMATPFASGVVALLLAKQREDERQNKPVTPVRTNAELLERVKSAAIDKGPQGFDTAWGWGVVDVQKLLMQNAANPPPPSGDNKAGEEIDLGLLKARTLTVTGGWAGDKGRVGLFIYV